MQSCWQTHGSSHLREDPMTIDLAGVSFCASDYDLIVLMSFQPSGSGQQLRNDDGMLVDHNPADASSTMPYSDPRSVPVTQELESESALIKSEPQARERPHQQRRLPACYRDVLPEPAPIVLTNDTDASDPAPTRSLPRICLIVRDTIQTVANLFGLWRQYPHRPSYDPDHLIPLSSLASVDMLNTQLDGDPNLTHNHKSPLESNFSVDILLDWQFG